MDSASRIASLSAVGHANHLNALRIVAPSASRQLAQCVAKALIQLVAEWSVGSRCAESYAQSRTKCAQPRIVPNARLSAPSLCAKWRARRALIVLSSHVAMFVVSQSAIGTANTPLCVLSPNVQ